MLIMFKMEHTSCSHMVQSISLCD